MQMSARGAQKKRDESKKLVMYSKQWLPGDTLRVFYPIFWEDGNPEIVVGAIWGHNVSDIKALGLHTAFIPSTTSFNEDKLPIGQPDITYQFSKIARAFVEGQKEYELRRVEEKKWQDNSSKKAALKEVEDKFDSKTNRKAIRPIIGPVQFYISTEVVSVKIANSAPIMDSIVLSSAPLSGSTISKLYSIMSDPKYAPEEGDTFFEVEWKYPTDPDKGESSKSAIPSGLTKEYRYKTLYPDKVATLNQVLSTVVSDSDSIVRRATRSIDPMKVLQAVQRYSFINSEYLDYLDDKGQEILSGNVEVLDKIGIIPNIKDETLLDKINDALEKYKEDHQEELTDIVPNPAGASNNMPSNVAQEVAQADDELEEHAPTLFSLLNNTESNSEPDIDKLSDDLLEDIDLGSLT